MKMRKIFYVMSFLLAFVACKSGNEVSNPLLSEFNTPFNTPPFNKIKYEHYMPAIDSSISEAKKEVESIINNPEKPTFENTIVALDRSGKRLNVVTNILFNLNSAETDTTIQRIVREASPKLTDYSNDINLNPDLFARVKRVWEMHDSLTLTPEQKTLLEKTYKDFERNGANLSEADKEKYREISKELADLSLQYEEHLLAETNAYTLNITKEEDLKGFPESLRDAAAQSAKEKGVDGWVITLDYPMYAPFMKYAENRELRKQLYIVRGSRCFKGNQNDNQEIVKRITSLRLELANLLGYPDYATFILENRMAENPEKVNKLLTDLTEASLPAAKKEVAEVQEYANQLGFNEEIQPWDFSFYSEKLKNSKYNYDEEELKPYFKLDNVINGVFLLANKLYDLKFMPNADIPVYNSDVKAYEVYDGSGKLMAILYLDFFPRPGKSGGAWMTSFRPQYKENGVDVRPFVSIVTNFTKPTDKQPSLLTHDEVTTFLHEFGHALHGMLSECTYASLSGTSVYRDFVELPSQIMENWALEKDYLDLFAVNYKTDEKIPQELVQKIIDSRNFLAGYNSIRQIGYGKIDMAWHTIRKPFTGSVDKFEKSIIDLIQVLPNVKGTNFSVAFDHIFGGGYAAGYYGYKWAEVLDADAFEMFKEKGIFNKEVAASFRKNILSKGGSEHPMVLYKRFRGQEPTVDALLKRSGLK